MTYPSPTHRHRLPALLPLLLLTLAAAGASAADNVKQSLDSAWIVMGRTTGLRIEAVVDGGLEGVRLEVPDKKYPPEVEVRPDAVTDTASLGNGRYELRRTVTLQSFDSGLYQLPPVMLIRGTDTLRSNGLALKVVPVAVDSLATIHDYSGALDGGSRWYDSFPDWLIDYGLWILLGLAFVAAGIWYWLRQRRLQAHPCLGTPKIQEPPCDKALKELSALKDEHLCERGREKEFYTRLTDILRVYLHDAFGVNAMEMTSSQIMEALERDRSTHLSRQQMAQVLQMADYVKFARMRPLPDDNKASFDAARNFVVDTRPAPEMPNNDAAAPAVLDSDEPSSQPRP